jgi:hypothetical protein
VIAGFQRGAEEDLSKGPTHPFKYERRKPGSPKKCTIGSTFCGSLPKCGALNLEDYGSKQKGKALVGKAGMNDSQQVHLSSLKQMIAGLYFSVKLEER